MINLEKGTSATITFGFKTVRCIVLVPNRTVVSINPNVIKYWSNVLFRSKDDYLEITLDANQDSFESESDINVTIKQTIRF